MDPSRRSRTVDRAILSGSTIVVCVLLNLRVSASTPDGSSAPESGSERLGSPQGPLAKQPSATGGRRGVSAAEAGGTGAAEDGADAAQSDGAPGSGPAR